ncbi:hypothetical protein [Laceyella tengchongensis]|uniref:hypothetical protein n=1 Tax=Laceyella tengchongensis TaxID=574699 RepID=UPI0012B77A6F|nr:hypothetical protein [Laceyella tengchongensis]
MRKLFALVLVAILILPSASFASEQNLMTELEGMLNSPISLSDIESVIKKYPPEESSNEQGREDLRVYENTPAGKYVQDNGTWFVFDRKGGGKVGAFVFHGGSTSLMELSLGKGIGTEANTCQKTTTCIGRVAATGSDLFWLKAVGDFWYNGSSSSITYNDGDYGRYFLGGGLTLTPLYMGSTRTYYLDGHRYSEVFTRIKAEFTTNIKYATWTFTGGTVESYVGTTVTGNTYGGCKRIS